MVTWFDGGHAFANGLDDAGSFVTEDDGEGSFGIFAGEGVCICNMSIIECLQLDWAS